MSKKQKSMHESWLLGIRAAPSFVAHLSVPKPGSAQATL